MKIDLAYERLPQGYILYKKVRIAEDRRLLIGMAVFQLLVTAAMIAAGLFKCPIGEAFSMGTLKVVSAFIAMIIGMVVYVFLHEGVHGFFIKMFSGKAPVFGFKLGMAYAGSSSYFNRAAYAVIAMAPLIIWTVVLKLLLEDVSREFFWYLYGILILNVTSSVGDLYVTLLALKAPKGTLAYDSGTDMDFYVRKEEKLLP